MHLLFSLGIYPRNLFFGMRGRKAFKGFQNLSSYCAEHTCADGENNPRFVQNSRGKKRYPGSKDLGFAIGSKDGLFISFVEACLRWDKNQRLTPEELMQHPWMVAVSSLKYSHRHLPLFRGICGTTSLALYSTNTTHSTLACTCCHFVGGHAK